MKDAAFTTPATLTLSELAPLLPEGDLRLHGVTARSAAVRNGMLFVATEADQTAIAEAIARGAAAIASETECTTPCTVPWFRVQDALRLLGHVASRFAAEPSRRLAVSVVAGGPGRRSLQQAVATLESNSGVQSIAETLERSRGRGSEQLQRRLLSHYRAARKSVVLECRPEDLRRGRLEGVRIASLVVAGGTSDNTLEHETLQALLLRLPEDSLVVMDADDQEFARLSCLTRALVISVGQRAEADFSWRVLRRDRQGQCLEMRSPLGLARVTLAAIDHGSALVAALAFAHAVTHGLAPSLAAEALSERVMGPEALWRLPLPGPFETWQARGRSRSSLERALSEVKAFCQGRVLVIGAPRQGVGEERGSVIGDALAAARAGDAVLVMSGEEHAADRVLIQDWFLQGLTGAA
jgi:UDP-N-acetylmuramyl tripeptide synthase